MELWWDQAGWFVITTLAWVSLFPGLSHRVQKSSSLWHDGDTAGQAGVSPRHSQLRKHNQNNMDLQYSPPPILLPSWHFVIVLHNNTVIVSSCHRVISAYFLYTLLSICLCNLINKTRTVFFFLHSITNSYNLYLEHKFPILTKFLDTTCLLHLQNVIFLRLERKRIRFIWFMIYARDDIPVL